MSGELWKVPLSDSYPDLLSDPRRDPGPIGRPMLCRVGRPIPELAVWRIGHGGEWFLSSRKVV
jgi:hypothetical protein